MATWTPRVFLRFATNQLAAPRAFLQHTRTVACPVCSAQDGAPCTELGVNGLLLEFVDMVHLARWEAADGNHDPGDEDRGSDVRSVNYTPDREDGHA